VQTVTLRLGDSFEILGEMEENSVWAVVCDPPYELAGGFMGKEWDTTGVAFSTRFWGRVFRVLKPGGVVKTFGGTRTFHRMAKAMEEAGFIEINMEPWLYSSGFPKSLDVSKQVDKKSGAKRKVIGTIGLTGYGKANAENGQQARNVTKFEKTDGNPVSENAKVWRGWGTALKPSWEPVVVARKPE
jgi:site-specific DNA-methyltransferase (adenine-specific)